MTARLLYKLQPTIYWLQDYSIINLYSSAAKQRMCIHCYKRMRQRGRSATESFVTCDNSKLVSETRQVLVHRKTDIL